MGINFNANITQPRFYNIQNKQSEARKSVGSTPPDKFERTNPQAKYIEKLERLFPHGELNDIYNSMCRELELDYPPKLAYYYSYNDTTGGGYTFSKNLITLNLTDVLDSDTKIIGVKNGEKKLLFSENSRLPLIINKQLASLIINNPNIAKTKGYDKLIAEPLNDDEQRKLVLLKIYHELIHARQHMIMRQTEGIGSKNVIKAWEHLPKDSNNFIIEQRINNKFKGSYWSKTPTEEIKYKEDSPEYEYAQKCLEAVRNYPNVTSQEYTENFIEKEAYSKSEEYIAEKYGAWD